MHDVFGKELKPGDVVIVPCIIKAIHASQDYCNCDLVMVAGMPPNMTPSNFSAINTRQVIKDDGSERVPFMVTHDGDKTNLRKRE